MIGRFRHKETRTVEEPTEIVRGFDDYDLRLGDVMRGERATLGKSLLDVQRELKIKATYIAAIENADPSAFETPGFIAGYVRSYARYLELDPDWAYRAFCTEGDFATAHGMSPAASSRRAEPARVTGMRGDPFAGRGTGFVPPSESMLSRVQPGAIGSTAVLLGLIALLGYGGYSVLNEVQKVRFVPVEQVPQVVAELDPLDAVRQPDLDTPDDPGIAPAASDGFERLYRPQALDVPILVARDGPIGALRADRPSALVRGPDAAADAARTVLAAATDAVPDTSDTPADAGAVQVVAQAVPDVVLMAVRPSWVRVKAADGTVLYEQIMKEGDRFVLPATEKPATLRTGESGAIYFAVNGTAYGPAGGNGQVTGNLALDAESLTQTYRVADMEADAALARVVAELRSTPDTPPGIAAPSE
ncbi:4-hydroxy-3-methylbut-2-en-1-yl diphosphate synthase [Oceaniovalibus guishaninsula JLT2003]|uniref:4-hydroxy-3-methylbut-2-en-1-yl diphosphate synthase n=1 Tax=Oceaniovalibus guishaninsula JLT2003 TaxID=1231392 RepID=K2HQD5_9RHOB|nr:RodZ domain-containing protein [Oceaniovalibus guishaninsula]EKE45029.1 4-hydroxy-3-methylbut-2-en-1-yl diphosphate synthase [Oceaniovalibus guishaninsula JLT2003]